MDLALISLGYIYQCFIIDCSPGSMLRDTGRVEAQMSSERLSKAVGVFLPRQPRTEALADRNPTARYT